MNAGDLPSNVRGGEEGGRGTGYKLLYNFMNTPKKIKNQRAIYMLPLAVSLPPLLLPSFFQLQTVRGLLNPWNPTNMLEAIRSSLAGATTE